MDGCWQGVARSPMDMDWRPADVEVSTVEVNGNGHHDGPDIGPRVELVPGTAHHINGARNGHAPAPVNEHHDDEATEPQQTLFSWAEFIAAEPVKPRRRN